MKLENDFDLIDALDDFNERFGVLKVLRKKRKYIYTVFSIYTLILLGNINKFTTLRSIIISILMELSFLAGYYILPDLIAKKVTKVDLYYLTAFIELCELIKKLNDLYLETDLELISKSTLYKKTYKVVKKEKLPKLVEYKYIMMPTYDNRKEVTETSIVQEHEIGTNSYILSLGKPEKELKLVFAKACN